MIKVVIDNCQGFKMKMKLKDIHTLEDLEKKLGTSFCACGCGEKVKVTLTLRSIKVYSESRYPNILMDMRLR